MDVFLPFIYFSRPSQRKDRVGEVNAVISSQAKPKVLNRGSPLVMNELAQLHFLDICYRPSFLVMSNCESSPI